MSSGRMSLVLSRERDKSRDQNEAFSGVREGAEQMAFAFSVSASDISSKIGNARKLA